MTKPMIAMKLDGKEMNTLGVLIEPDGAVTGLTVGQWQFWRDTVKLEPVECVNPGHWEYLMRIMAARRNRNGITITDADVDRITDAIRDSIDGDTPTAADVAALLQITVKRAA